MSESGNASLRQVWRNREVRGLLLAQVGSHVPAERSQKRPLGRALGAPVAALALGRDVGRSAAVPLRPGDLNPPLILV